MPVFDSHPNCLRTELEAQLRDLEEIASKCFQDVREVDARILTHSLRVMGLLWSRFRAPEPDDIPTLQLLWYARTYEAEQRLVSKFLRICDLQEPGLVAWETLVEVVEALEFIDQADQADWSAYADLTQRCEIPSSIRAIIDNPERTCHAWMEV